MLAQEGSSVETHNLLVVLKRTCLSEVLFRAFASFFSVEMLARVVPLSQKAGHIYPCSGDRTQGFPHTQSMFSSPLSLPSLAPFSVVTHSRLVSSQGWALVTWTCILCAPQGVAPKTPHTPAKQKEKPKRLDRYFALYFTLP